MTPHELMSQHFTQWAFTANEDSVYVHNQINLELAKKLLAENGFEHIRVYGPLDRNTQSTAQHINTVSKWEVV